MLNYKIRIAMLLFALFVCSLSVLFIHLRNNKKNNNLKADEFYCKALDLQKEGKYEEAIEYYDEALELRPGDAHVWNSKGMSFAGLRKYKEAVECFDRALEIYPEFNHAKINRGTALHYLRGGQ